MGFFDRLLVNVGLSESFGKKINSNNISLLHINYANPFF